MTLGGSGLEQKEDRVAARRPTLSEDRVPCRSCQQGMYAGVNANDIRASTHFAVIAADAQNSTHSSTGITAT
jgi:hypothetical protein